MVAGTPTKTIAMVVTSKDKLAENVPGGFWFEELATPYWEFKAAGYQVVIASPAGGKPTPDPLNLTDEYISENIKKFQRDENAMNTLNSSMKLSDLDEAAIDAIFFVGGFASTHDFPSACASIIEKMVLAGKPTAAICGGVCSLNNAKIKGNSVLTAKHVTGLMDAEAAAVKVASLLPFSPEGELKKLGANYQSGEPFGSHAVTDGLIITGQNFASSNETAQHVLKALQV